MVKIDLETSTLAVLLAGLYCTYHEVNSMAIPESVYLSVAEKLEYFIGNELWDFEKISFEQWVQNCLMIYPKAFFTEEQLDDLKEDSLYWEVPNGNAILFISMNIGEINGE